MSLHIPTLSEIKRALHIQESIESLKAELASIFGGAGGTGKRRGRKPDRKSTVTTTASGGSIVGNGSPLSIKRPGKKAKTKRILSPEAREKIAAAQRKRWAKQKKQAKKTAE